MRIDLRFWFTEHDLDECIQGIRDFYHGQVAVLDGFQHASIDAGLRELPGQCTADTVWLLRSRDIPRLTARAQDNGLMHIAWLPTMMELLRPRRHPEGLALGRLRAVLDRTEADTFKKRVVSHAKRMSSGRVNCVHTASGRLILEDVTDFLVGPRAGQEAAGGLRLIAGERDRHYAVPRPSQLSMRAVRQAAAPGAGSAHPHPAVACLPR